MVIANSNETKASTEPTPLARIMFESAPITTDIYAYFCMNPFCSCKSASLYFYEADVPINDPLFKLVINHETWQLESLKSYEDNADHSGLINEFIGDIDQRLKDNILKGVAAKARIAHDLRDDIDVTIANAGGLVFYDEIYDTGKYAEIIFIVDGRHYLATDCYCPKPTCDCKDVLLTFYSLDEDVDKHEPMLVYKVKFNNGKRSVEDKRSDITLRMVNEIYRQLDESLGNHAIEFFEHRYNKIKEWGAQHFNANGTVPKATTAVKIGRNKPCPCGSGKKYKKCCGL